MNQIKAIIFDCDGVMFESRQANLAYYNRILAKFGYPAVTINQSESAHLCHTASSPVVLSALMSQDDLVPALDFAATIDYREFIPDMEPEANLTELLDLLVGQYQLAVATNRGNSIQTILEHFNLHAYFTAVVNRQDVVHPKPAPDMLLLAVDQLNVAPEKCLFVGDSELDKMAAAEANISFVGYGGAVVGKISLSNHLELLDYLG
ncbi:MAG: HAD-IA family hydrolase [Desulfuromonadales bacterium]|nr:HAD-IA family hydrolase [Desulfuromonadales bacterium]